MHDVAVLWSAYPCVAFHVCVLCQPVHSLSHPYTSARFLLRNLLWRLIASVLTAHMHHHVFSYSDKKETVELDKKQKLTEKPDLNDIINVVTAKIPGEWETVSITIYMYM